MATPANKLASGLAPAAINPPVTTIAGTKLKAAIRAKGFKRIT